MPRDQLRVWFKGKFSRSASESGKRQQSTLPVASSSNPSPTHTRPSSSGSEAVARLPPATDRVDDTTLPHTQPIQAVSVDDWDQSVAAVGGITPGAPTTETTNDAFRMALERHTQSLTEEERKAFSSGNDISLERLLADVQDFDNQHSKGSGSRKCVTKIKGFLDIFDVYLNALGICIQHSPQISSLVVGGIRLVVDLGRRFVNFFDSLTDMICSFGEHLYYLSENGKMHGHYPKVKEVYGDLTLCAVYGDLLGFCKKARDVFTNKGGGLGRYTSAKVAAGLWTSFQSDIQATKIRFNERVGIVMRTVGIEEQKRLYAKELSEAAEKEARERGELLSWLSGLEFDDDHERIHNKRHKDTGNWFLESESFKMWFDAQKSCLLWCHGSPGVGKSVLTSIALEKVRVKYTSNENVGITFIYFSYQNQEAQKPAEILSTLIKQLCRRRKSLPDQLKQLCKQLKPQNQRPSLATLEALFLEMINAFEHTFLLIDAMDEWNQEHRTHLLLYLVKLSRESNSRFKVFVASRKERDIEHIFNTSGCPTIQIEAKKVDEDIAKFVRHWILSRPDEQNLCTINQTLKDKIENALTSQSNGMFLWVQCQLDYIYKQPSVEDIEEALNSLPDDLNAMYFQILRRINRQASATKLLAKRVLMWVFTAGRPLRLDELVTAVAIEPSSKSIEGLKKYTGKTIIDACGNLLTIDDNKSVRPIHYTVQEFFTLPVSGFDNDSQSLLKGYQIVPMSANSVLARPCIQYILFKDPARHYRFLYMPRGPSFFWYACQFWDFHLRGLQALPDDLSAVLATFLSSDGAPQLAEMHWERSLPKVGKPNALNVCLALDLLPFYLKFHELGTSSSQEGFEDVMGSAATGGSVLSLRMLLDLGYPVDAADKSGARPLYYAAHGGHQEAAKFLISQGACVNAVGGIYGSALQAAAYRGEERIVQILLESGADVNTQGGEYGNALQAAAYWGSEKVVQTLLESGADVNAQGKYGNALQAAAYWGSEKVVQILLESGADVNAQGKYGNALQAAAYGGEEKIVQILLESGADVNAQGGEYGNALQAAAYGGVEKIVQILLESGADVSAQVGKYGNALQAANEQQNEKIADLLRKNGSTENNQA